MQSGDVVAERFAIERLVNEGGMGAVYRARDLHGDGLAAIKVVRHASPKTAERFAREARILAELRHPGIVRYVGHGRTERGELFLAMEWLDGEDLGRRLEARELSVNETMRLVTQVAQALAVAHARDVVHRDIKPSNLFLVDDRVDHTKVLDFGVARLVRLEGLTDTGHIIGTPRFMAPEQARGDRDVDARADVFALGGVLFRCLSGVHAFDGHAPAEILWRLVSDEVAPRVRALRPEIPRELDELVARMLAKDPDRRPPDAAAVLGDLLGFDLTPPIGRSTPSLGAGELGEQERRLHCLLTIGTAEPSDEIRAVVAAHEGELAVRQGVTMVVLEGPRVATDQARQAAQCALALRRAAASLPMALVMGRRPRLSAAAANEALARAAPLLAAPADAVRLDAPVAGLLDARFVIAGDDHGLVLRGESSGEGEVRTLLGKPTPFVGRDQELALLESIFDVCVRDGEARAVLVTGGPGLGKSRLRQELLGRLARHDGPIEVWTGRGDPMRAGAPFSLLGEAVRRAAGIAGGEPLAERRELLAARVARHLPPERARPVTDFIGELAGVPFPSEDRVHLQSARRDPRLLADQIAGAFEEWLAAECAAHPLILVFEDLHWGDAPTVKLTESTLRALAERPLLVLGLARPEVQTLFPKLWAGRGLQTVHLGELSRRAGERLVRQVLGADATETTVARVVERAGGNAFYLEELIRAVADGHDDALPETVLAMAEARLDALPGEARRVLRAGSVFGEVFWADAVRTLLGPARDRAQIDHWLDELVDGEVLRRRPAARFAGDDELAFRHGLVRDAAYAMLTDEDRVLGHRLAAAWLEQVGETDALVLAEHAERGADHEHAATRYRRAAEQALAGNDPDAAVARAERAVGCGAGGADLGALRLLQAIAHRCRGDNAAARDAATAAMAALPERGDDWWVALGERAAACGKLFEVGELKALAAELERGDDGLSTPQRAVSLARAAGQCFMVGDLPTGTLLLQHAERFVGDDPGVRAHIESARNFLRAMENNYLASSNAARAAAQGFDAVGDRRNGMLDWIQLASTQLELGRYDVAVASLRELTGRAEELGLASAAKYACAHAAMALALRGDHDEAYATARRAIDRYPTPNQPRIACLSHLSAGAALYYAGRLEEAEGELRRAIAQGPGAFPRLVRALAFLGLVRAARGDGADARRLADEAFSLLAPGMAVHEPDARLATVEGWLVEGDRAAARAAAATASRRLHAIAAGLADPDAQRGFLTLPNHRRIVALAEELGAVAESRP